MFVCASIYGSILGEKARILSGEMSIVCYGMVRLVAAVIGFVFEKQLRNIEKTRKNRRYLRSKVTELIDQIEEYIREAHLLSDVIEKSNFMIDKLAGNDELQNHYLKELEQTVKEYRTTIKSLDTLFQEYFAWERKIQKTRNLRYRRLHKLVLRDLSKPVPPTITAS